MTKALLRLVLCALFLCGSAAARPTDINASFLFKIKCSSCHTVGEGIKVGPDLQGVTERRERDWILAFVRDSSKMIQSGDPDAVKLFEEFKRQRMPEHTLADEEIHSLLDYIEAGGPASEKPKIRLAQAALPEEIELGRQLFSGEVGLSSGGAACTSCHNAEGAGTVLGGGTLAPDLTRVYSRYKDMSLTLALREVCFPQTGRATPLTDQEQFALKAFFYQIDSGAAMAGGPGRSPSKKMALAWLAPGLVGAALALGAVQMTLQARSLGSRQSSSRRRRNRTSHSESQ